MRDEELPREDDCCFILNLDEASDPGTHWTAVWRDEFYDSYGMPPPRELEDRCKWYNPIQHQRLDSPLCGIYAAAYIHLRNKSIPAYAICHWLLKNLNSRNKDDENTGKLLQYLLCWLQKNHSKQRHLHAKKN